MKNVQKESGVMNQLIMTVGIKNHIMKGISIITKKKNGKAGIIDELIMDNVTQTWHGVIKKRHHMKKNGSHHGTSIKETSV